MAGLRALALAGLALAVWLPLGFGRAAIQGDRAYFTYFAQAILRGESIYATDFLGYPPIGPLVSAAAMAVGRLFGLPTFLAPRYAAVAVAVLCVVAVHAASRRATGTAWAALVAGVALVGFERWAWSAFATLEPKHLVAFLTLVASLAIQSRRPFAAGAAALLAAGCWQPAGVVVPVAFAASVLFEARRAGWRPLAAFALGAAAGALPTFSYLAAHDAFYGWWQRAVVIPASFELATAGAAPLRPIEVMRGGLGGDLGIPLAGAIGFAAFAARSLRGGLPGFLEAWLGARSAAMPLLTLLWCGFSAWTFGGLADLWVLLPLFAFWAGAAASEALRLAARLPSPRRALAGALVLGLATTYALRPSVAFLRPGSFELRGDPLARQRRLAEAVATLAGPGGQFVAIAAEEFYVLREVRAPVPFLRLSKAFLPFLPLVGLETCEAAIDAALALEPAAIAMRLDERSSACERAAPGRIQQRGYALARRVQAIAIYERTRPSGGLRPGAARSSARGPDGIGWPP